MTTTCRSTVDAAAARPSIVPGALLALLAAAAFGSSGIAARPLLNAGWSAGAVVLVRIGVAALLLLVPTALALRGRWSLLRRRAGILVLFGIFGVACTQVCYFNAVRHLSIGVALLLEYSGILLVVGWLWLRTRVAPAAATLLGAVLAIAGLSLVLNVFSGPTLSVAGVLWALGAAVGLAVYFVLGARTEDDLPPIVVVTGGMVIGAVTLGVLGVVGMLPMHVVLTDVVLAGATLSWIVPVLWLCLVTALVAYLAGVVASRRLGSTMASFFGLTEVLFAVLFAWLLLGEVAAPIQLIGGALVLLGVVLVRLGELRRDRLPGRVIAAN